MIKISAGIAINKKEAKRKAARLMFNEIHTIGVDKFNKIKQAKNAMFFPKVSIIIKIS